MPAVNVRSFVAWLDLGGAAAADPWADEPGVRRWREDRLNVSWWPRGERSNSAGVDSLPVLVLGDASEWQAGWREGNLAGGVPLRYETDRHALVADTSIVGLPPVYIYRGSRVIAIGSDIHLLARLPGVELRLDPQSVHELGRIGHPVAQRTLFRDLELAPSGARLTLRADGALDVRETWTLPDLPPLRWSDYIEAQVSAFTESVRRLDLSGSFLSLTAGLDTRTVFAALVNDGRGIPAATMTGRKRSLDARAAAALCRAYGLPHHDIVLDERFVRDLPSMIETASRLSGGLASVDQAPEVYMYRALDGFSARLSGNLGNQVGRGGTEGVSTRGADLGILAPDTQPAADGGEGAHWLLDELTLDARARTEFILKREIPFTLAGNYTIGSHFARQQTPYASRVLIETLAQRPREVAASKHSMWSMRLRDLSHRFLGEPASRSFQRTLLREIGGFAATYPINWGWRAAGGVAPVGLALGVATLFGMAARAKGLDDGFLHPLLDVTGLPALHDFRESRRWLRRSLRDFTFDTLTSDTLFDQRTLQARLKDHFEGKQDHYATITFAMDVALARKTLNAG